MESLTTNIPINNVVIIYNVVLNFLCLIRILPGNQFWNLNAIFRFATVFIIKYKLTLKFCESCSKLIQLITIKGFQRKWVKIC